MKVIARTIAAAAAVTAFAAAPALADSETFVFQVAQSQLTNQADAERAYQRLSSEASRYCRALDLDTVRAHAECRLDVVGNVVEAVGHERLATIHRDRQRARALADAG